MDEIIHRPALAWLGYLDGTCHSSNWSMMSLTEKTCKPCEGGTPPLSQEKATELLAQVPGWEIVDGKLHREFKFKNFSEAGKWLDKVRVVADAENHHPDIHWYYNKIVIEIITVPTVTMILLRKKS